MYRFRHGKCGRVPAAKQGIDVLTEQKGECTVSDGPALIYKDPSAFQGESALHLACLRGLKHLVKKLLTEGADPNVQTKTGDIPDFQTALHIAAANGDAELVRIFVEHSRKSIVFSVP